MTTQIKTEAAPGVVGLPGQWEEIAGKHSECRVFIEFAYANYESFQAYLIDALGRSLGADE